ncbi:peptidylprolyl isomerase [Nocardioides sp.]|uniref:peptidylprolyl isomerase n=1 Tax=Nocardioides sp. TaxID=35761 RepID=UPI00351274CC
MTTPRRVLLVGLVLVTVIAGVIGVRWWQQRLPDDAVFRLDGQVYVRADLDAYLDEQRAMYGTRLSSPTSDEALRLAAHSYALSLVVEESAVRRGVDVTPEEVTAAMQRFVTDNYPGGRSEFVEALATEGVTEAAVASELRRQLVVERLFADVTDDVVVSADEVEATYREDPDGFAVPPLRRISQIAVPGQRRAALLVSQLDASNFAATARRVSLDEATAASGGSLGFVAREDLQRPFGDAAFAARPGVVFGPVKSADADYFYVGIVTQVRPGRLRTLDEVRGRLAEALRAERALGAWQDYLRDLLRSADLEYAEDFRPEDPFDLPGSVTDPVAPKQGDR